jgi:transposase
MALVPKLDGLMLEQISIDKGRNLICLSLKAVAPKGECPLCRRRTTRIHSRYMRTLADLPWSCFTVRVSLGVRRFFCANQDCRRRIFTERLPDLVLPYARRTLRQGEILRVIGLALGGRAGSRLLRRLQLHASPHTILDLIRRAPGQVYPVPRVLGVDDFALRKGRTYGTILVDLEKRQPVDLLPGRSADLLTKWLKDHPGSEVITRDRSQEYARGITEGAPAALQIADRFHLLCNLRDALERVLDSNRSKLSGINLPREGSGGREGKREGVIPLPDAIQSKQPVQPGQPPGLVHEPKQITSTEAAVRLQSHQRRRQRYQQARELHAQGVDIKAIAKQLKLSRMTIYRYLRLDTDPVPIQRHLRPSMIDPYVPYLYQRWGGGCQNGGQLWRELRDMGYPGSFRTVIQWAAQQRKKEGILSPYTPNKYRTNVGRQNQQNNAVTNRASQSEVPEIKPAPSSRRLAWFLVRDPESLSMEERAVLAQLKQASAAAGHAYHLVHDFHRIVKGRLGNHLDCWLKAAKESGVPAMENFALGIEKDKAAVAAALTHEWSNGQVEGQVNRLKLRKRQLYGRASFDLLRHYVLDAP